MRYRLGEVGVETDGDDYWIAPNAVLIGRVRLEKNASVWWNAVLRADNEPITVGEGSNVQDGSVLHTDPGFPLTIGRHVTVGHMVMLHGCTIGDESLIGIGSVVMNGARIGKGSVVGAKALITEGKEFPDYSMIMGAPGKVVRQLTPEEAARFGRGAQRYVQNWRRYRAELRCDD
jgi:carbonic anhydrase/acetyltransferase-like protein (isoleucine patch superfamily)